MFKSALVTMTPVLFAASAGLLPALGGTLNISLEGLLLAGAFASFCVYYFFGSIFLAVAAAALAGVLLSAVHAFFAYKMRANIFITGLAVNLLSAGLCAVLSDKIFNNRGVVTSPFTADNGLFVKYLAAAVFILLLIWLFVYKTPYGFRLRACDKNPHALESLGIKPQKYKITSILFCGFLCAVGGSFLSLNLGSYVPGMSAGKGWIALVIIFLGKRNPLGILIASFAFGLADNFSHYAQGFWKIPSDFVLVFPYVCILIAMILVSMKKEK